MTIACVAFTDEGMIMNLKFYSMICIPVFYQVLTHAGHPGIVVGITISVTVLLFVSAMAAAIIIMIKGS